jgi:hypothetical protein
VRVIRYLTAGFQHAFGLHRPGRKLPVLPDDILLASYPNSGNTWMQFLAANLLHPDQAVDSNELPKLIVDPDVTVKRDIDRVPRPRVVKSYSSFDPRYRRVIYLVRDPRDVAISQYRSLVKSRDLHTDTSLETFLERFLMGELDRYTGSWGENVGSWLAARSGYTGFLVVRYEDVVADTARELALIAEFAGWPTVPERISQAVERSSSNKSTRSESTEQGSWRGVLNETQVARIEAAWSDIMSCLGYELAQGRSHEALEPSLIGLLTSCEPDAVLISQSGRQLNH